MAKSVFDEDIELVRNEVIALRSDIREEFGRNIDELFSAMYKFCHVAMRTDLLAMRACHEQGARWGPTWIQMKMGIYHFLLSDSVNNC